MEAFKDMNYSSSRNNLDRFIPNRSAMDMGYAQTMINETRKFFPSVNSSPYQIKLAEALNMNRNRILAFRNKPPAPVELYPKDFLSSPPQSQARPIPKTRCIPKTPELVLGAVDLVEDYYFNLLDWGSENVLAIALDNTVCFWDANTRSYWELESFDDQRVTSVNWAPDGRRIAIGLNNSDVQLWDSIASKCLRTLRGCHSECVGSLAWNNNNILTTGGIDGLIVNNDMRVESHIVETYRGHRDQVCGLKWSSSGQQLASGGSDNLLYIWDRSAAYSSTRRTQWLHRCKDHTASVRALAWCPFESNLLASGGGNGDHCIKFWNTRTGACLNSIDTGSQVCCLLWNKHERELLSSHGWDAPNKLTLWKYPSMVKMAQLTYPNASRVLYMAQSPDGCQVASASDSKLRFWNIFGVPKPAEPFAQFNRIR